MFLAGPPDRGHGSVLKRKRPPAPLIRPETVDFTYTSLALGLQPPQQLPETTQQLSTEPPKVQQHQTRHACWRWARHVSYQPHSELRKV